jgi:hypothetical protein
MNKEKLLKEKELVRNQINKDLAELREYRNSKKKEKKEKKKLKLEDGRRSNLFGNMKKVNVKFLDLKRLSRDYR